MLTFLFYVFVVIVLIQFCYYVFVFKSFSFDKTTKKPKNIQAVSVIVCAKNEEKNVSKLIPLLLEQNHPDFEIVLINDASTDDTLEVFETFQKNHTNIKIVKVENNEAFWGNKKFALTMGIKASTFENLLFIDADCIPNSKDWILEMTSHFSEEKTIVLGYGAYTKIPNSFLNKIIRFETLFTALQYFSWARIGKPYMGVGRNLAYKKTEFFNVDGFKEHMKIRSGDDDLFINQVGTKQNTAICYAKKSFTYSNPKTSFGDWFNQKRRHVSTANHYKLFDKLQLSLFYISQLLFIVLATLLLSFQFQWIIVLGIVCFRYLFTWVTIGYTSGKLKERDVVVWYPIIEVTLIFTQLIVFMVNKFSKPIHWK